MGLQRLHARCGTQTVPSATPVGPSECAARQTEGRNGQAAEQQVATRAPQASVGQATSGIVVEPDLGSDNQADGEDSDTTGGTRWRGRRRRRGGRGTAGSQESQSGSNEAGEASTSRLRRKRQPRTRFRPVPGLERSESARAGISKILNQGARNPGASLRPKEAPLAWHAVRTSERERLRDDSAGNRAADRAETPFVLPGESLRKYGATPEAEAPKPPQEAVRKPASTFKLRPPLWMARLHGTAADCFPANRFRAIGGQMPNRRPKP